MSGKRLAVIGGGAKAAAICAKAAVLRNLAGIDITVTVFERDVLGAAWDGQHGFTDGLQRLCTPAERDIGYPYAHETFGREVASAVMGTFSWSSFALHTEVYASWVDRGRLRPTHGEFARYLKACIEQSRARLVFGTVNILDPGLGQAWRVCYRDRDSRLTRWLDGFDGVVVTGTGPCRQHVPKPKDQRILDGISFWPACPSIEALAAGSNEPIVILGSGGTAAAVAAKLARLRVDRRIVLLGDQPTLFARVDSFFENRMFRDPDTWALLSAGERRRFTDRLTRGTVWANVLADVSEADLVYQPGRVMRVRFEPENDPTGEIFVEYATEKNPQQILCLPAAVVIDATGFDATWFADLLPPALGQRIRTDQDLREAMRPDLSLPLPGTPPLHAPMLSQAISPAYTSLMALGSLSDAVLRPYVAALT